MDPYRYKAPREVAESERLFQRDLRALRVVDDERDLRPAVLRREDVDRVHVDPRAGEAPGDLRELTGTVPREQDRLPDVGQVEELLDEPVHAEAPTPMGRHAVPEGLEIEIEVLDGQALLLHPPDQDVISVLPLPPGRHLVALVFEVEGATGVRIFGLGHHVERLHRGRIAAGEVDLMAFLREALPEELLRLRVDVVSVPAPFALAPQDLECLLVPDAFEGEFRADR